LAKSGNLVDCQFSANNNTNPAIQINCTENFHINRSVISGYNKGISLTSSGTTLSYINSLYPSGLIRQSTISNCGVGIELFKSASAIIVNNIYNNGFGVKLYNNSYTTFESVPTAPQIIRDCSSIELYATPCSCPGNLRYNQIIDEDNLGNSFNDPLFYLDYNSCCLRIRDLSLNYWGENFIHSEDIYPPGAFLTAPIWDPCKSNPPVRSIDEILYQTGLTYFSNEDYLNAETTFKELIETYPESRFAIAAMHELFALENFTDNDFYKLYGYLTSFTPADSNLFNVADFLATRCHVKEKNWQPAINWYENRIENPPSYQDSVFAVIDLGHIHLLMEADTAGNNGAKASHCSYRLENVKPKSKQAYETTKATLLATLPQIKKPKTEYPQNPNLDKDKKGILGECVPNPTNGNATIYYEIFTEGVAEIHIYNAMGQLVKTLPQGTLKKGGHKSKVSFAGFPAGLYHYTLFVNGERTDSKKVVVN